MFPIHNLLNDSLLHNFVHNYMFLSLNCHVPHVRIVCMFINLAATVSCICCFLLFNSYYTAYSSNPQLLEAVSFLLQLWKYCYRNHSNTSKAVEVMYFSKKHSSLFFLNTMSFCIFFICYV